MNFIRHDYILVFTLCLLGTINAKPTNNSTGTAPSNGTDNNVEKYASAIRQIKSILGIAWTSEEFVKDYGFFERSMKSFFAKAVQMHFTKVTNQTDLIPLPKDIHFKAKSQSTASLKLILKIFKTLPSKEEVRQVFGVIDKVNLTSMETYEKYPLLKTVPQQLLKTIALAAALRARGLPILEHGFAAAAVMSEEEAPLKITTETFENDLLKRIREKRAFWKHICENTDNPITQRLLKAIGKLNMTEEEFIDTMVKVQFRMNDDLFEVAKKLDSSKTEDSPKTGDPKTGNSNLEALNEKDLKSPNVPIKDKNELKAMMALLRTTYNEDVHKSDEEWAKTLA